MFLWPRKCYWVSLRLPASTVPSWLSSILVSSQKSQQRTLHEFDELVQHLWHSSACWLQLNPNHESTAREACLREPQPDLAGRYARYLEQLHEKLQEDPTFQFDFFDHSCRSLEQQLPLSPDNMSRTGQVRRCRTFESDDRTAVHPKRRKTVSDHRSGYGRPSTEEIHHLHSPLQHQQHQTPTQLLHPSISSLQSPNFGESSSIVNYLPPPPPSNNVQPDNKLSTSSPDTKSII